MMSEPYYGAVLARAGDVYCTVMLKILQVCLVEGMQVIDRRVGMQRAFLMEREAASAGAGCSPDRAAVVVKIDRIDVVLA